MRMIDGKDFESQAKQSGHQCAHESAGVSALSACASEAMVEGEGANGEGSGSEASAKRHGAVSTEPTAFLEAWHHLTDSQRELLIPRLLRETRLGKRIGMSRIPWRPTYDD